MFTTISFLQKLIKGGVGIKAGGGVRKIFKSIKINKRGGAIIRYSRVQKKPLHEIITIT